MFRLAALMAFIASPAPAWEFSASPLCTLEHATGEVTVRITYDAALPEYTIALTLRDGAWPASDGFSIVFGGGRALTIGTDRHSLSGDGRTLTVTDTGFGNVLNGLEFNSIATAIAGSRRVDIPLQDAGEPVQAFRACPAPGLS